MTPTHSSQTAPGAHRLTLAVFACALAYLLLLRRYGFQLEDEGLLLFQFQRVLLGQRPYVDFHTGYTPGFFALGEAALFFGGGSVTALRSMLAVINALTAAGLCELTRRAAGRWIAPIPPLLWLAFVPVYVGEFAAFNVPYPTWPATLGWVGLALILTSWVARPRWSGLALAGLVSAALLAIRPNAGAFALAGGTWVVCTVSPRRTRGDAAAAFGAAAFMLLGVWYTFQFRILGTDAVVFVYPTMALAVLLAGPWGRRFENATAPASLPALTVLGGSFVLPTLAWFVPLYGRLGDRLLFDTLLIGADYQTLYYRPHPAPEPYAVAVVGAVLVVAATGRAVARGRLHPLVPSVFLGLGVLAVAVVAATTGLAPEGVPAAISSQLENASYWLAATAHAGAVFWLFRGRALPVRGSDPALMVMTALALAMYLQIFPRADFMHQITAAPFSIVVAAGLLARVAGWWAQGARAPARRGTCLVRGAIWTVAAAVLAIKFGADVAGPIAMHLEAGPAIPMPDVLDVDVEAKARAELDALARTAAFLRDHTEEGEPVWTFPATSAVLFAAGRPNNPTPHDYWFPGRPDHGEEQRVLEILRATRPRYIVTLNAGWTFFDEAPAYFAELRRFAAEHYRLAARYGRFDVLGRNDVTPEAAGAASVPPPSETSNAAAAAAIEPDLQARRQAARRWMAALTPREAAHASLPEDPRDAVRLLRAIRDGGDMRAAGWAIVGFRSSNPRIRGEAVDAMTALAASLRLHRLRFANDFDAAMYRPFVTPYVQEARELARLEPLRAFADGVLELAGENPEPTLGERR